METIKITKSLGDSFQLQDWFARYTIEGWGNPAGEVYDLKNGHFLALVNSASTGYSRKVFRTFREAIRWVENSLRKQFPAHTVEFNIAL